MEGASLEDSRLLTERRSLCLSSSIPGVTTHSSDEGFDEVVQKYYSAAENDAAEKLILLKARVKDASLDDFWTVMMEGITNLTASQFAFVVKRILVDDQDSAVEMPPIGEPGSCLMGVAFYYNDGHGLTAHQRDYKYSAYGAPCGYMKHDKVFMIPGGLPEFIIDNPNQMPFPLEAYMGIPLFSEGKCFAHFGAMWSAEGLRDRGMGWGFVEMLLHSLEDIIEQRLVSGQGFAKPVAGQKVATVIPQDAITAAQSLKPYARSLSHELRTPMQGVVGMLDIMHITVQESLEAHPDPEMRKVYKTLRDNIEVVQDSSRRAVEAADNVVYAYDLNMQVPGTPDPPTENEITHAQAGISLQQKLTDTTGKASRSPRSATKRRRSNSIEWNVGPLAKHRIVDSTGSARSTPTRAISPRTAATPTNVEQLETDGTISPSMANMNHSIYDAPRHIPVASQTDSVIGASLLEIGTTPSLRHTKIRDFLRFMINDSLRVGGRPESAIAEDTETGEVIEVRSRSSKGDASTKIVEWSVDPSVPEDIYIDERDLAKLVSVVFLNAVKFTERGRITLTASLSRKTRYIIINVKDTGTGIPKAFRPLLFKPFSREDDSLTRQNEGLGLGLLVAKGLARRIGGDLVCIRSDTDGPDRGSEFELRVPLSPSDACSRTTTPSRTPTPSRSSVDRPLMPSTPDLQVSPLGRRQTPYVLNAQAKTSNPSHRTEATNSLLPSTESRRNSLNGLPGASKRRGSTKKPPTFDRNLAKKYPLTFLVAEDNKINRKLLVSMLTKLGYSTILEAFDGAEAVRLMAVDRSARGEREADVILMDLWMPTMDGYEAAKRILAMQKYQSGESTGSEDEDRLGGRKRAPIILAVSADVTDEALDRATEAGMVGFMTKPYKLMDLEKLIIMYCTAGQAQ